MGSRLLACSFEINEYHHPANDVPDYFQAAPIVISGIIDKVRTTRDSVFTDPEQEQYFDTLIILSVSKVWKGQLEENDTAMIRIEYAPCSRNRWEPGDSLVLFLHEPDLFGDYLPINNAVYLIGGKDDLITDALTAELQLSGTSND